MAASYPSGVKSFTAVNDGDTISDEMFEEAYDEITAMQQALLSTGLAHHLLFVDATYDIGQSGATRPRHLYLSGDVVIGGNMSIGSTQVFGVNDDGMLALRPPTVTVANDGTAALANANEHTGLVVVVDETDSYAATFIVSNGTATEVSDPNTVFSHTADTATSTNVYVTSSVLTIQNKRGGSRNYRVILLGANV